mgnify:CR=1 FL=1
MDSAEIKYINNLLKSNRVTEANERLNNLVDEDSIDYWMLKGSIEQKNQNWGAALNAFLKVLEIDKDNKEAQNSIHLIQNILNFWNPEMFNP